VTIMDVTRGRPGSPGADPLFGHDIYNVAWRTTPFRLVTSIALALIHSSSVTGLSLMWYLPSVRSGCQASRQCSGSRFLSQKIPAVTSGGTCST
jgi:hypothetical protein